MRTSELETELIAYHRLYVIFTSETRTVDQLELRSNIITKYLSERERTNESPNDVLEWEDVTLNRLLSSPVDIFQRDGPDLVRIIKAYPRGILLKR